MRPGPGIRQTGLRLAVQLALGALALRAFEQERTGAYLGWALASGAWFGGLLSLTHDALHHKLTGHRTLDEMSARAIAWPIAWPIGVYARVHLLHHRWSGGSLQDPERIQPTQREYAAASPLVRWYFRHQIWVSVLVAGAFGLLVRLATDARRHRAQLPRLARTALGDVAGIGLVTGSWIALAYGTGGWRRVLACAGLWIVAERCTGAAHQVRNHAEHYGLWGARATRFDTQYHNARDIETGALGAWYFNHLHRHATHHALVGVPYYNLEAAHQYLREGLAASRESFRVSGGYLAEVLGANRLAMQGRFIQDAEDIQS